MNKKLDFYLSLFFVILFLIFTIWYIYPTIKLIDIKQSISNFIEIRNNPIATNKDKEDVR